MAITTAFPSTCKQELFGATHDFTTSTGHVFNMALFDAAPSGTFGAASTNYSEMGADELDAGGGYTTTGQALTIATGSPGLTGTTGWVDFDDEQWTSATFSTDGCEIYNTNGAGNEAVYVGDFGGTKTVSAGTLTVQFPATGATAILRIA